MSETRTGPSRPALPSPASDALQERLEALLQRLVAAKTIRHAVLGVQRGDGSFRWVGAAGEAHPDGTPMRPDTPFLIASVTKLYIAAAILRLAEQGLVSLDAPLGAYLQRDLYAGIHRLEGHDYSETITVRHLLAHASGLPDLFEDRPQDGGPSLLERIGQGDLAWSIAEAMDMVRRMTPHFPPQPLDAPRCRIRYSDTNYQLLIAIIEAVTGVPIPRAFDALLYQPLGLEHTYHPGTRPLAPGHASIWMGEQVMQVPRALESFGDLISTADELLAFLQALMQGRLFASPVTLETMMARWNRFGFSLNPMRVTPGWPIEYGLGIMRFALPRLFTPLRAVPAVVGHTGATGSWLFYCPALDLYLCGTVDQLTAAAVPFRLVPRLLHMFAQP